MLASSIWMFAALAAPQFDAKAPAPKLTETRYCREMGNASSRMYAIKICKTRAQWKRWEACNASVTRYCTPRKKEAMGRQTAFAMNEDSRIICRVISVTGSRIKEQNTCLPKREWDRMFQEANQSVFKRIMDFSTLPRDSQ